ncbi:MAG: class I SAM-dependent methyltransferase [Phycisphaerales bacterium]
MRLDPDIFERVLATYEAIGLTRGQAGLWCIPQRDARLLMEAIDPGRHRRILEIGTYVGVSTMLMALHAPQAEVHSIDPDLPLELGTPGAGVETEAVAARGAQELAAEAAARLGVADRVHLHRGGFAVGADFASRRGAMAGAAAGPSGPASPVIGAEVCRAHGPFDLAFVDGLHYADAVHADLALVGEHLAPGGAIVLHDVIGLWGGNVRWAVHRFLERHPEFVFWHEPYREIYLSVGLLQRRAEAPADAGGARRLRAPGPRLVDDAAFRSALLAAAFNDSSPTRMIELRAADVPTLRAEASGLAASFESVIVEAQDGAARRWLDALPAPIPGEIVACLGALDELDQPAAAALLHELAARERPVLFGFTPPGERGVARPFSRTLPQNTALLAAAGVAPLRDRHGVRAVPASVLDRRHPRQLAPAAHAGGPSRRNRRAFRRAPGRLRRGVLREPCARRALPRPAHPAHDGEASRADRRNKRRAARRALGHRWTRRCGGAPRRRGCPSAVRAAGLGMRRAANEGSAGEPRVPPRDDGRR